MLHIYLLYIFLIDKPHYKFSYLKIMMKTCQILALLCQTNIRTMRKSFDTPVLKLQNLIRTLAMVVLIETENDK